MTIYSELLGVSEDALREVAELCTPPDMEKEALQLAIKVLAHENKA